MARASPPDDLPGAQQSAGELFKRRILPIFESPDPSSCTDCQVHVDMDGRMERDWQKPLGDRELAGEADIESRWPSGYQRMTEIDAGRAKKATAGPL